MSGVWPAARRGFLALSLVLALGLDLAGQMGHLAYVLPCTVFALLLLAAGQRRPSAAIAAPAATAAAASSPAAASSLMHSELDTLWMSPPGAPLPGMMALLDADARCSAASPGLARWLDSDRDLMRGQSLGQMFGATAAEALAPQVAAALAGNMRRLRCLHLDANDTERWLQLELQPQLDEYGLPMGCTLLAMDVTPEQRQLSVALRNERRLRFMLDQVPAAVAYVDTDLCFSHINRGQAQWLGQDPAELVGQPLRQLLNDCTWRSLEPALLAALRGQAPASIGPWPAGPQPGAAGTGHQVADLGHDGKVLGVCTVFLPGQGLDLSPAPSASAALGPPQGEAAAPQLAQALQRPDQTLLATVHQVLDHAHLDAGSLAPQLSDVLLRELVEDVVHQLAPQAHARQLELCCRIDEFLPPVLSADARRLHQVLSHLVANALRFTSEGEVLLDVQRQDEHTLRFLVHDTGPGLSEAQQKTLLAPLPAADAAAGPPADAGSQRPRQGLGLPLARGLVASMGGDMGVQSVPGEGASFWFTLPLLPGLAKGLPAKNPVLAARHVLVVDDNPTCRELLAQQLTLLGQRCGLAANGPEALKLLRQARTEGDPVDLVLLDMLMPGMDGLTLASLVRTDPLLKAVRLVLVSARPSRDELARAHQAGVAAHLDKPVRRRDLVQALDQALAQSPAQTNLGSPQAGNGNGNGAGAGAGTENTRPPWAAAPGAAPAAYTDGHDSDGGLPAAGHLPLVHARVLLADSPGPQRQRLQTLLQALGCDFELANDGEQALQRLRLEHFDIALLAAQLPLLSGSALATAVRRRERDSGNRRRLPLVALVARANERPTGQGAAAALPRRPEAHHAQGAQGLSDEDDGQDGSDGSHSAAACRAAGMDDVLHQPLVAAQLVALLTHWLPSELVEAAPADAAHPLAA